MFDEIQEQFSAQRIEFNKMIDELDDKIQGLSGWNEIQTILINKQTETIKNTKTKQDSLEADMKRFVEQSHENRVKLIDQLRIEGEIQTRKITEGLTLIDVMRQTVAEHTNQITDLESK